MTHEKEECDGHTPVKDKAGSFIKNVACIILLAKSHFEL